MAKSPKQQPSAESKSPIESAPPKDDMETKIDSRMRRVFIAHGKNKTFIAPIKDLLRLSDLDAVVADERQSVSQPVPDKVMTAMRSCGAAIIHIESDYDVYSLFRKTERILNPNVLIEIGAAMALYGWRYIFLVKAGVSLPSNLQGLFEVRYSGQKLDRNAKRMLKEAINDIKNHPLP